MKCLAASTNNPESYEAGVELAQPLIDLKPEVIFLFSTVYYEFEELFGGIHSLLGDEVLIFGGTGDGIYSSRGIYNIGAGLLALNSEGTVQWQLGIAQAEEQEEAPAEKTVREAWELSQRGLSDDQPGGHMVLADFHTDGSCLVDTLNTLTDKPFLGGLTGDSWLFEKAFVFGNDQALQKAVAILSWRGDFDFLLHAGTGWKPQGQRGIVEKAEGNTLYQISGKSTYDFISSEIGRPPTETELGVLPMAAYEENHYAMRTPYKIDIDQGSLTYFAHIGQGTAVQICTATQEDILAGISQMMEELSPLPFTPQAALVISCGGRKWILEQRVYEEIERLFEKIGKPIPVTGFPSFGEIGPYFKGYGENKEIHLSRPYFHNVTFVVMLIK